MRTKASGAAAGLEPVSGPTRRRRLFAVVAATLSLTALAVPMQGRAADPVIAAAGELVCDPGDTYFSGSVSTRCQQQAVSDAIVDDTAVEAFLPLGNLQNLCGGPSAFSSAYDPTYGRLLGKTYPVPGNVEYRNTTAAPAGTDCEAVPNPAYVPGGTEPEFLAGTGNGYFGYFGTARTGGSMPNLPADAVDPAKGFYTYDIGSWNVIAINTNDICKAISCRGPNAASHYKGSAQEQWLRSHLASVANRCVIAYMNAPRWSSNLAALRPATPDPTDSAVSGAVSAIWTDLYQGGAEVLLGATARNYERFHPMDASGKRDNTFGVTQFVVGTGGIQVETNKTAIANSAAMQSPRQFGYLRMVLKAGGYSWAFRNVDGTDFDAGSANCHGAPASVSAPHAGATVPAGTTTFTAKVNAPESTDTVDFYLGSQKVATATKATDADCKTDIIGDKNVWYTSPYCIYSVTGSTADVPGGATKLRAVTHSTDPATPGATTSSVPVTVKVTNNRTGVSSIRPGGSTPTLIMGGGSGSVGDPAFSIGGSMVALRHPSGILVGPAGGTGLAPIAGTAGASKPAWGPKNATILYLKSGSVYSVPVGGGASTRLATGRIVDLAVSPNGTQVVFQRIMSNGRADLFTMTATGKRQRNLTRTRGTSETQPTWKTNTVVGFAVRSSRWRVFIQSVRGGAARAITAPRVNCQQPAFSPNGATLACVTLTGATASVVRTVTSRGVVRTVSTNRVMPTQPAWRTNTLLGFTHR